jgi:hypothetical protein
MGIINYEDGSSFKQVSVKKEKQEPTIKARPGEDC